MKKVVEELRQTSARLLREGTVREVIGWREGRFFWQGPPHFASNETEAEALTYPPCAAGNLSKYLLDHARRQQPDGNDEQDRLPIALFARGCEARAVNRLAADRVIERSDVYLVGLPCPGVADADKLRKLVEPNAGRIMETRWDEDDENPVIVVDGDEGQQRVALHDVLQDRCLRCIHPEPVTVDQRVEGCGTSTAEGEGRFADVRELEGWSADERCAFWSRQFARCIGCNACRNVCPACNCIECIFETERAQSNGRLGKAGGLSGRAVYHLIRMQHVSDRCIECGACETVCPVGIPVRTLMTKAVSDVNELFGPHEAGGRPDEVPPFQVYDPADPDFDHKGE